MIKKMPECDSGITNQNKCAINHCQFKNDSITRSGHFLTKSLIIYLQLPLLFYFQISINRNLKTKLY